MQMKEGEVITIGDTIVVAHVCRNNYCKLAIRAKKSVRITKPPAAPVKR